MNIAEELALKISTLLNNENLSTSEVMREDYKLLMRAHATIELMASALRTDDENHRNEICADLEAKGVFTQIDSILAESGHKKVESSPPEEPYLGTCCGGQSLVITSVEWDDRYKKVLMEKAGITEEEATVYLDTVEAPARFMTPEDAALHELENWPSRDEG